LFADDASEAMFLRVLCPNAGDSDMHVNILIKKIIATKLQSRDEKTFLSQVVLLKKTNNAKKPVRKKITNRF